MSLPFEYSAACNFASLKFQISHQIWVVMFPRIRRDFIKFAAFWVVWNTHAMPSAKLIQIHASRDFFTCAFPRNRSVTRIYYYGSLWCWLFFWLVDADSTVISIGAPPASNARGGELVASQSRGGTGSSVRQDLWTRTNADDVSWGWLLCMTDVVMLWPLFSVAFLTLYTLQSVCIFSILLFKHFLRYWQGEFVY